MYNLGLGIITHETAAKVTSICIMTLRMKQLLRMVVKHIYMNDELHVTLTTLQQMLTFTHMAMRMTYLHHLHQLKMVSTGLNTCNKIHIKSWFTILPHEQEEQMVSSNTQTVTQ